MFENESKMRQSEKETEDTVNEVPEISIRVANTEDAATVAHFVHALLDELSGGEAPTIAEIRKIALGLIDGASVIAMIAYADNQPLGVMTMNECAAIYAGGKFGEISELYVDPNHRSHGIAKQLLDSAQSEAVTRGWKRIEVGAPGQPEWQRTLNFYLRNGFEEVGPRLRRLI